MHCVGFLKVICAVWDWSLEARMSVISMSKCGILHDKMLGINFVVMDSPRCGIYSCVTRF